MTLMRLSNLQNEVLTIENSPQIIPVFVGKDQASSTWENNTSVLITASEDQFLHISFVTVVSSLACRH